MSVVYASQLSTGSKLAQRLGLNRVNKSNFLLPGFAARQCDVCSLRPSAKNTNNSRGLRSHRIVRSAQSYGQSEKQYNMRVEQYNAAAKDYMKAVLGQAQVDAPKPVIDAGFRLDSEKLKSKLKYAIEAMQDGLVERDTEVRLLLLAALSQEHVLYIGPPGTAKSEVGRRLSKLVRGAYFERLLTRFSVPEELFGPLSMRALEEDKYIRQTRGYLPDATIAFVDEIFKANSAILNTLLTLLNERLFDNGSTRQKVPLITLVGASNELPESEELDALYDRFLVRRAVRQVTPDGLTQMLKYYSEAQEGSNMREVPEEQLITPEDFAMTRAGATRCVRVPNSVIQMLADIRSFLQEKMEPPVYVSDRRLVKSIALMQVAAFCNGRDSVTEYDCLLLQHVLWNKPEQANRINDWLLARLSEDDGNAQVKYLLQGAFSRACRCLGNEGQLAEITAEVGSLRGMLTDKLKKVARHLEGDFSEVEDNLWLSQDDAGSLAVQLKPKLAKTKTETEVILHDVVLLELALDGGTDAVMLANLLPKQWADFIRNSPMEQVKPLGTRPLNI